MGPILGVPKSMRCVESDHNATTTFLRLHPVSS